MSKPRKFRAARWLSAVTVTLTLMIVPVPTQAGAAEAVAAKPTVVLVHGAWADGSSWGDVVTRLQRDGYLLVVVANPLRSLSGDAAYLAAVLQQATTGPVVLVGHSYGGAVITNAATADPDVTALVYINAFAPAQGETVFGLAAAQPGSALAADPSTVFTFVQYPGAPAGDVDAYVKHDVFRRAFANDLPARTGAALGAAQRPITLGAGSAPSGEPAWASIPSWYLVGTEDKVLPPTQQRIMAQRANAVTVEVRAGHLSMLSRPGKVVQLIEDAAAAAM